MAECRARAGRRRRLALHKAQGNDDAARLAYGDRETADYPPARCEAKARRQALAYSAATAIACLSPGMVKPSLSSLAIMSLPAFSSISTSGGRTGVHAESLP